MIRWTAALALLLCVVTTAQAQVAEVKSGEHADFTRIVVQADRVADWSFGRHPDGYELRLVGGDWRFNLSRVFDLIPRTRLASIAADPGTGSLRLGIACACHAIPFEFRPGIVVIDLKDGPPPAGSSFETALEPATPTRRPLPRPGDVPQTSSYNWLDSATTARPATDPGTPSLPLATGGASLEPLRAALLSQLSVGLSSGVIDLAEAGSAPTPTGARSPGPWARVTLGETPDRAENLAGKAAPLTPKGEFCVADTALAVQDWGPEGSVSEAIAGTRLGLVGEFDQPDMAALAQGARMLIHLGFGAEARQLLRAFPEAEANPDHDILRSLARLVDGETDADGAFKAMALCDTAAALWATLSTDAPLDPGTLDEAALRRAFSALPVHLRRSLGPGLVERSLTAGNTALVVALRDSMERGGILSDPTLAVLNAQIDLAGGEAEKAEARVAEVLQDPGPVTAEAIVALVDARSAQDAPIDPGTVTAIEALLKEQAGRQPDAALRRALVLARFGAGDVAGAFTALSEVPEAAEEAWDLLATRGGDADILAQAMLPKGAQVSARPATELRLAERLFTLGFAEAALHWLGDPTREWDAPHFLLYGRALLSLGDARAALAAVENQDSAEAAVVKARAMIQLGLTETAVAAWDAAGDPANAAETRTWTGDWAAVVADGPESWRDAAGRAQANRVTSIRPAEDGALSRATDLADSAAADRASLDALLQSVPMPSVSP